MLSFNSPPSLTTFRWRKSWQIHLHCDHFLTTPITSHLSYCSNFLTGVFLLSLSFCLPQTCSYQSSPRDPIKIYIRSHHSSAYYSHWIPISSLKPTALVLASWENWVLVICLLTLALPTPATLSHCLNTPGSYSLPGLGLAVSSAWHATFPAIHMAHWLHIFTLIHHLCEAFPDCFI